MTADKALKLLGAAIMNISFPDGKSHFNDFCTAFNMACEALAKQIERKPYLWNNKKTICPNCHRDIAQSEPLDVYCKWCGQKIDWGEVMAGDGNTTSHIQTGM